MLWNILFILLIILLLMLLVFLLLPVSLRISYEGGAFHIRFHYALWTTNLFPPKSGEEQPEDGEEESGPPSEKKSTTIKAKPNFDQILYSLDVLPKVLTRALRRTFRRIHIAPLKVHLLIALDDPADTAVLYGRLHGVLNATLPLLHRAIRIDDQDIRLFTDFTQDQIDCIADVGVKIRPLDVLVVAFLAAGGILKWYIGYKKRADKSDPALKTNKKSTAQANTAA